MSIKQFNGTYIKEEDRLLFRFNTSEGTEFRLWLTRLISMSLLATIRHSIQTDLERKHSPLTAQVIQEFQEEKIRKTANFHDPYIPAGKLPLGADPILVVVLNIIYQDNFFSIAFKLKGNKKLSLKLPVQAIQSLVSLLEQLEIKAQWTSAIILPQTTADSNMDSPEKNSLDAMKIIH
jgi:hypothetical protein